MKKVVVVAWGGLALACGATSEPMDPAAAGGTQAMAGQASSGGDSAVGSAGAPTSGGSSAGGSTNSGGSSNAGESAGGMDNSGGVAGTGGAAAGAAGQAQGGEAGAAQGGAAGAGGQSPTEDQLPWRDLNVTAGPDLYQFQFNPSDADPMAVQQNGTQRTGLDTRVPLRAKLVVDIGFNGGSYSAWAVARGFHVFGPDFLGVEEYEIVRGDPEFYGDARLEALEGVNHTDDPDVDINYHDSLEGHVTEGLKYLEVQLPGQDWGYYLNQDGTVRWSDVILTGLSHGASSVARFAMVRRLGRVVSVSGPRDNTCGTDPACAGGVVATWFSETPATPLDRIFAIAGMQDPQYPEILYAMEQIGYLGEPANVQEMSPPYGDSHRLIADDGHVPFCGIAEYDAACEYMFGIAP